MTMTNPNRDEIESIVETLLPDVEWRRDYSGRCMYGKTAPLAFTSDERPGGRSGKILANAGFCVDNMGLSYIYYLRGEPTEEMAKRLKAMVYGPRGEDGTGEDEGRCGACGCREDDCACPPKSDECCDCGHKFEKCVCDQ